MNLYEIQINYFHETMNLKMIERNVKFVEEKDQNEYENGGFKDMIWSDNGDFSRVEFYARSKEHAWYVGMGILNYMEVLDYQDEMQEVMEEKKEQERLGKVFDAIKRG